MKRYILGSFLAVSFFVTTALAADAKQPGASTLEDQQSVAVTIYNSNLGLVKDTRNLKLPKGNSQLRFMDVAQQINPATVHIKSLTSSLEVLEQNYQYDLLNPAKLLDKYVGKELTLVLRKLENQTERFTPTKATLLSNNNGQVWQMGEQIVINPTNVVEMRFEKLPADLIAKPTLVWLLKNGGVEAQTVEASYLTNGINWKADYVAVINKDDTKADLNGWVSIDNQSGTAYREADLKLVAGDVNRVQEEAVGRGRMFHKEAMVMADAAPQFEEQKFFEYHLYTLQRPATLLNNEKKQISLLSSAGLGVKKELVVNGQSYYFQNQYSPGDPIKEKVGVYVEFKNAKENNLGMPLPAGTVRVYKADASGSQQFVGEDKIDHTPKDELVRVKLGDAFDVVAERKQTEYKVVSANTRELAYEIRIRNHKDEAITVIVNEPIGGDWKMLDSSFPAEKSAAFAARFRVPVPEDGEKVLTYRVRVKY